MEPIAKHIIELYQYVGISVLYPIKIYSKVIMLNTNNLSGILDMILRRTQSIIKYSIMTLGNQFIESGRLNVAKFNKTPVQLILSRLRITDNTKQGINALYNGTILFFNHRIDIDVFCKEIQFPYPDKKKKTLVVKKPE